jgi:hypothetical protein
MKFEIEDVNFTIEKRNDGSFFVNILQGEDYDQQCVQFYDINRNGLIKLRDKINDALNN